MNCTEQTVTAAAVAAITATDSLGELHFFHFPTYLKCAFFITCSLIMLMGCIGNIMVPVVILRSKEMRNSTNFFLINLSIADLLVLLVCTPTIFIEISKRPEIWILGSQLCKLVPFVELTVAHTSVLTILAISFERFYAICKPFKAGYICTKKRASCICCLTWILAAFSASPIIWITQFQHIDLKNEQFSSCLTITDSNWKIFYFIAITVAYFVVPMIILVIVYAKITGNLMLEAPSLLMSTEQCAAVQAVLPKPSNDSTMILMRPSAVTNARNTIKARKKVIVMLGLVVVSFFCCLIPFRTFTLWILLRSLMVTDHAHFPEPETYYNIVYFCRIMIYLNSAINPILYNLMSSKFREGFRSLFSQFKPVIFWFYCCGCWTSNRNTCLPTPSKTNNSNDMCPVLNGSAANACTKTTLKSGSSSGFESGFSSRSLSVSRSGSESSKVRLITKKARKMNDRTVSVETQNC